MSLDKWVRNSRLNLERRERVCVSRDRKFIHPALTKKTTFKLQRSITANKKKITTETVKP
jgi:hypothetical protein